MIEYYGTDVSTVPGSLESEEQMFRHSDNGPMTYRQFAELILKEFSDEQMDQPLMVYLDCADEFIQVHQVTCIKHRHSDILELGHPYLVINF